jgi:hypothetical protein
MKFTVFAFIATTHLSEEEEEWGPNFEEYK